MNTKNWLAQNYPNTSVKETGYWDEHVLIDRQIWKRYCPHRGAGRTGEMVVGELPEGLRHLELDWVMACTSMECDDLAGWDLVVTPEQAAQIEAAYAGLTTAVSFWEEFIARFTKEKEGEQ